MTNDPESTNAQLLASAELCGRLRYNASIWQRKADDDHPLVKDQLDAANAIDRLAYQAQGYCKDAKHAESVADELRRLLEKEKERADKFMWQVRDTCTRAEAAETALAAEKRAREEAERERDRLRDVIERDRTKTAEIIGGIRAVVGRWSWLGEGRGSYAWDDDRYQDEFRQMLDALKEATDPLRALAADWTDCPQDYQAARIDWKAHSAALARALEELSAKVDAFWNDPERPSVHRMRSKSVHELSDAQRRARSLLAPRRAQMQSDCEPCSTRFGI